MTLKTGTWLTNLYTKIYDMWQFTLIRTTYFRSLLEDIAEFEKRELSGIPQVRVNAVYLIHLHYSFAAIDCS